MTGLVLAAPIQAESHLPAAPDYYLGAVLSISLAEQYAWHCDDVEVDGEAMGVVYSEVLTQLDEDGISTGAPHEHMLLPPQEETDAVITDMLQRNQSTANPSLAFCTQAKNHREEGSLVGRMLMDASN